MGEFSPFVLVKKFVIVCCPSIVFESLVLFLVGFLNFLNDGRTFKELIFSSGAGCLGDVSSISKGRRQKKKE